MTTTQVVPVELLRQLRHYTECHRMNFPDCGAPTEAEVDAQLAAPAPAGDLMCPECKLGHLLYECPACSASNYPAPAGDPCTCCGAEHGQSCFAGCDCIAKPEQGAGLPYGVIDPDYARVFTIARCLAWSEGYALAMHGSFSRDLDLIAVPWTDSACEPEHLARRIEAATDLRITNPGKEGEKPHGRMVWTLKFKTFADPRFVDLSILARQQSRVVDVDDAMVERALSAFYGHKDWTRSLQREAMSRALRAALEGDRDGR